MIARIHLAITSMFVCINVFCRFVQHTLPNKCSSFCRHAEFKFMFDLKTGVHFGLMDRFPTRLQVCQRHHAKHWQEPKSRAICESNGDNTHRGKATTNKSYEIWMISMKCNQTLHSAPYLAKSFGARCITNDHTNHSNQEVSWSKKRVVRTDTIQA